MIRAWGKCKPCFCRDVFALLVVFTALILAVSGCERRKAHNKSVITSGVTGLTIERRILLGEGVSFGAAGSMRPWLAGCTMRSIRMMSTTAGLSI